MKTLKKLIVLTSIVGASLAITSPAYANGTSAISGATVFSDSTVHISSQSSTVQLRGQSVKQISAGSQDSAGY